VAGAFRRRRYWVISIFVLLLAAFIVWRHNGAVKTARGPAPQAVGVAKAVTGAMPVTLDELGTVTPTATVTVLPQISGYLVSVPFTEGQMVAQGQLLAQIDPRPYQIQLEQDQAAFAKDSATLGQAQSDLGRYEQLLRQNSIQEQTVTDARFQVAADRAATEADQANIDTARLNLTYCRITSPVAGRVGLRLVDPGNYVTSGSSTGIAVVTTVSPTTVMFSVAQTDLAPVLVRVGQGAILAATAYASDDTTKLEDGALSAVDNQVNTATGMVKLRATFPNTDGALFPNEFVNVHLLVNTLTNVVLVPAPALQTGAPGAYVYVVNPDKTVSVQPVTAGPTDGVNTVITKGVAAGDVVVTDGVDRLSDGAKVVVAITPTSAPAGAKHHRHHWSGSGDSGGGGGGGGGGPPGAGGP
jgi:multidrug efflux system membrane fusion protein